MRICTPTGFVFAASPGRVSRWLLAGLLSSMLLAGLSACGGKKNVAESKSTPDICGDMTLLANADIAYKNSTLYPQQWYLNNTGQSAYAQRPGTASSGSVFSDLNMGLGSGGTPVWNSATGRGVRVRVVDSGLDIAHPSLNCSPQGSCYLTSTGACASTDPSVEAAGDHGTMVAGIIGMADYVGTVAITQGGIGVAPHSTVGGYNFLSVQSGASELAALSKGADLRLPDIFNMSYGTKADVMDINSLDSSVYVNGTASGAIYVKSAGNGFNGLMGICLNSQNSGVACTTAASDVANDWPYLIVVAALNADGNHASYSSAGPNVWISGFGGEFGSNLASFNAVLRGSGGASSYKNPDPLNNPAILTTDVHGCDRGVSKVFFPPTLNDLSEYTGLQKNFSDFDYPFSWQYQGRYYYPNPIGTKWMNNDNWDAASGPSAAGKSPNGNYAKPHPDNPNCNYSNTMNGTSAAAPTVSGVLGLMKEVWPEMNWRDARAILAQTARKVDPGDASKSREINGITGARIDDGWITNRAPAAAGGPYHFNDKYGFGAIDASAAVKAAAAAKASNRANKPGYTIAYHKQQPAQISGNTLSPCQSSCGSPMRFTLPPATGSSAASSATKSLDTTSPDFSTTLDTVETVMLVLTGFMPDADPNHTEFITADNLSNIGVQLTSPSGTPHLVMRPQMQWAKSTPVLVMSSNAFYGEPARGNWTVTITNYGSKLTVEGSLILFGD